MVKPDKYESEADVLRAFLADEIGGQEFGRVIRDVFCCWYDPFSGRFLSLDYMASKEYSPNG